MVGVRGGISGKGDVLIARLASGGVFLSSAWGSRGTSCFGVEHEYLGNPSLSLGKVSKPLTIP